MKLSSKNVPDRNVIRRRAATIIAAMTSVMINIASASASTATFIEPSTLSATETFALSSSTDSSGVFLGLGDTLSLLFDMPFGTNRTDRVTIFTLPPSQGNVRATVSFGTFNNGSPTFVRSRNLNFGGNTSSGNLFNRGCSALGGCDYIEITVTQVRNGATGAEVDYVDVNGDITTVTAPSPEPSTWLMMITGFFLLSAKLKKGRDSAAGAHLQPFISASS